jgi:O-antigen ligase
MDGQDVLIHLGEAHPHWPSTVNPSASLLQWAFSGGVWLAACNLWLVVRSRHALRLLFAVAAVNTFVLAVFGTLQKLLVESDKTPEGYYSGFFFGTEVSPQARFFSTFIYNNHWGAFLTLFLAVAIGLLFHYSRHLHGRDRWHTPLPATLVAVLFIALSAPMSASRSATALALVVVIAATGVAMRQIAASRGVQHRSSLVRLAAVGLAVLAFTVVGAWLARDSIEDRARDTREAMVRDGGLFQGRFELYRDTWTLAMQKPWFGWGLGSFGTAFQLIHPRPVALNRQYEQSYVEAHSDWLQSVAENGFIGTGLLLCLAGLPLLWLPWTALGHPLVGWPLLGCALVALYAWVEFPFANGAVVIGFWTVYFAALRYATLQQRAEAGADE